MMINTMFSNILNEFRCPDSKRNEKIVFPDLETSILTCNLAISQMN